jgi:cytochrome c oxidase cbb3-type subunit 3
VNGNGIAHNSGLPRSHISRRLALVVGLLATTTGVAQTPPKPKNSAAFPQRLQADQAVLDRGRALYGVNCNFCHGSDARGGEGGPNLLRSQLVLQDKNGELIAPVVQRGRPDQGMPAFAGITITQVADLAAYIHNFPVDNRDPARFPPPSIVVGDAKAGEQYFQAKCGTCHSVTGDLKGIGGNITDARVLQNTFLMPGKGGPKAAPFIHVPPVTVTVAGIDGELIRIDDFSVTLKDSEGVQRTFRRDGDRPKVELHDPLRPHLDLLRTYTDKDIHNLTAYLVTLK